MITLTPRAAQQVRKMKADLATPNKLLRISVENGGCSGMQYGMSFDDRQAADTACESEGESIVIDPTSVEHLRGTSIDFDDGLQGHGFEIRNPNAKSTCGCGKSFA